MNFKDRFKDYSLKIIELYKSVAQNEPERLLGYRLLQSGTMAGAKYTEACAAKTDADFSQRLGSVLEKLEVVSYWLGLLELSECADSVKPISAETDNLHDSITALRKKGR